MNIIQYLLFMGSLVVTIVVVLYMVAAIIDRK